MGVSRRIQWIMWRYKLYYKQTIGIAFVTRLLLPTIDKYTCACRATLYQPVLCVKDKPVQIVALIAYASPYLHAIIQNNWWLLVDLMRRNSLPYLTCRSVAPARVSSSIENSFVHGQKWPCSSIIIFFSRDEHFFFFLPKSCAIVSRALFRPTLFPSRDLTRYVDTFVIITTTRIFMKFLKWNF